MITIEQQRWSERPLQTRLPFRYGIAVMTLVPHVWLDLEVTIAGRRCQGRSADHLPPKWFTKDPARDVAEEIEEMRGVLRAASRHAAGLRADSVGSLLLELDRRQAEWARVEQLPPLLAHFGASLVERALLDAYCRRYDATLASVLHSNQLGLRLGDWHPTLAALHPGDFLAAVPLSCVRCRHTVGLSDPLEESELASGAWPDDGLPVALATAIRAYGLSHFKIKVAEHEAGLDRLERVVAVIERETQGNFAASLDGNETFSAVESFRTFWSRAVAQPRLRTLWPRLLFVEQPFGRGIALSEEIRRHLTNWSDRPALIIDESGAEPADLERALDCGYAGTSHKNCKGVVHGVANACLLAQRRAEQPERMWIMSGEDLSNVGPVALPQDLAAQAALGNASVERNGHHYFAGLSAWPEDVREAVLETYPDLYTRSARGWPTLCVADGTISTTSASRHAFGGPLVPLVGDTAPWFEI